MLFKSFLSALFVAQAVRSSSVERSTGKITCATYYVNPRPLAIANAETGGYPTYALVEFTSPSGQRQLYSSQDSNADQLQVIVRHCDSNRLGLHFSNQLDSLPVKLFLASDESKCLQRYADLHSNDPEATTHIVIADCSDVDDENQAKQLWSQEIPLQYMNPLVVREGKQQYVSLVLSDGDSGQVLATLNSRNSRTSYSLIQQ